MHISLLVSVEKAFAVRFRVGEVEQTHNIGEFADLILKRLQDNQEIIVKIYDKDYPHIKEVDLKIIELAKVD